MFAPRLGSRRARSLKPRRFHFESLESRKVMAADPLPVLLVIADGQDFYYKEYGDTRTGLQNEGLDVVVAASTTNTSYPHPGTGEPDGTNGAVTPDIALEDVDPSDYSAIVFVGGWGASQYQYAFPGDYIDNRYDGDPATKAVVNDLINEFVAQDKYVAGVCHGVTVLAWARVDGVSPLQGKTVSVPWIGSPAVVYGGVYYGYNALSQYDQAVANGAIANTVSGQYGLPGTVADDVVVDGKIITAENYDTALNFGIRIGQEVKAAANAEPTPEPVPEPVPEPQPEPEPPANQAPTIVAANFHLAENTAVGTWVGSVTASDPDAGQTLTYSILGGNTNNAFAIDPLTGALSVAHPAALDFEVTPLFNLQIGVSDDGAPALAASAVVTVALVDLPELPPGPVSLVGNTLHVQGTPAADTIYIWTSATGQAFAWMAGQMYGGYNLGPGGRIEVRGGDGNDRIYATDSHIPVSIFGEAGNDQITGGFAGDILRGGAGVDRIWGQQGDDLIDGGTEQDFLDGREGNDILLGGDGVDYLFGSAGRDLLLGGAGSDQADGGGGEDLLIGGTTSYDASDEALFALLNEWASPASFATRVGNLTAGLAGGVALRWGETVHDDGLLDCLYGNGDADWIFLFGRDSQCAPSAQDWATRS